MSAHHAESSTSNGSSGQPKFSNGPHIRSRITVVCAECKRLKLKCDRRTPCSSCIKRDTVQRCVYSQAAAEKVDVQSLHNRILEIERVLAQMQAAGPSPSASAALACIPALKQTANAVAGPSRAGPSTVPPTLMAGLPCNDRALLAQGASGSSVVISLDDVVSLWLSEYEAEIIEGKSSDPRPGSISFAPGAGSHLPAGGLNSLQPPAPFEAFLPPPSAGPTALPQVTAALVAYLPADSARSRFLKAFRETMLLHPSFNVPHFEQRIAAVFSWAETGESAGTATPAYGARPMSKQELARDIFLSSAKPGAGASFFSAAAAAFALGALVARDEDPEADRAEPLTPLTPGESAGTPATLFALSEQALQFFEKTSAYDLDSIIAMILQVLYMLHEGQMSVAQSVFPCFVADSMGHPPLIADNTHTTHIPADVDEDRFTPSSTSLPIPENSDKDSTSEYFALKCKLAQLSEPPIDQAANFEADVEAFLNDLPPTWRFEPVADITAPVAPLPVGASPFRLAQKCELAILAHRLVLKTYLPFLKTARPGAAHQAVYGAIGAAHNVIGAARPSTPCGRHPARRVRLLRLRADGVRRGRRVRARGVQEPHSLIAGEGVKDVACAFAILQDIGTYAGASRASAPG
ncbi:uncharacterized protein BXZ73DRAFT_102214 [Epithele typhae]|uniref:uncharacterized protein n=1 Tax=Epithele typhae TaxID=378194 RepID=UPI0020086126|nr:uncharacterized protein BXZ73DRAFT_102214 [Epithele typhae]KAH9929060.1 hypothetical protein BXZ73DRAFT_102214 [Epithele typhae]